MERNNSWRQRVARLSAHFDYRDSSRQMAGSDGTQWEEGDLDSRVFSGSLNLRRAFWSRSKEWVSSVSARELLLTQFAKPKSLVYTMVYSSPLFWNICRYLFWLRGYTYNLNETFTGYDFYWCLSKHCDFVMELCQYSDEESSTQGLLVLFRSPVPLPLIERRATESLLVVDRRQIV